MATVTITIPDAFAQEIVDNFAIRHQWSAEMAITKTAFLKRVVQEFILTSAKQGKEMTATLAARDAVDASAATWQLT